MSSIASVLDRYGALSLEEIRQVTFLKRCDYKYLLSKQLLQDILQELADSYYVVRIDDRAEQHYLTTYFDTPDDLFYLQHHNSRNNRYKVRKRSYEVTHDCYLEVKHKCLSGMTNKQRISAAGTELSRIAPQEKIFLSEVIPIPHDELSPKIDTHFDRITIVDKAFTERITIDLNLRIVNHQTETSFATNNFVIIEVKCDKYNKQSLMRNALKCRGIRSRGFSKYCVGRALTEPTLKRNRFKQHIKTLVLWNS